jgi:predicted transcriptional regulator
MNCPMSRGSRNSGRQRQECFSQVCWPHFLAATQGNGAWICAELVDSSSAKCDHVTIVTVTPALSLWELFEIEFN